jgi:hypothetical protein
MLYAVEGRRGRRGCLRSRPRTCTWAQSWSTCPPQDQQPLDLHRKSAHHILSFPLLACGLPPVKQLTSKQLPHAPRPRLQSRPKYKHHHRRQHAPLPAEPVRDGAIEQRPQPRSQEQRGDKPPLEAAVGVDAREEGREGLHLQDARNDALVVAEEEAAERGKLALKSVNVIAKTNNETRKGFGWWDALVTMDRPKM